MHELNSNDIAKGDKSLRFSVIEVRTKHPRYALKIVFLIFLFFLSFFSLLSCAHSTTTYFVYNLKYALVLGLVVIMALLPLSFAVVVELSNFSYCLSISLEFVAFFQLRVRNGGRKYALISSRFQSTAAWSYFFSACSKNAHECARHVTLLCLFHH